MLTAIFIVLVVVALGAIAWVVVPKIPQLRALEIEETAEDKLKRLKKSLVVGRITRKARTLEKKIFSPETRQRIGYVVKDSYVKLKALEDRYRTKTTSAKVQLLLKRGEDNITDDPEFAEKCFLDVLNLDSRNLLAYEGLSRIYLDRRNLGEAMQTLEFLVKLNPGSAHQYLFDIAEAYLKNENLKEAAKYGKRALTEEPGNPKYLDFLTEVAILNGDKKAATEYIQSLQAVNPENAKIETFLEKISALN
ncbi:hypothetical protein HY477_01305 [Candidatus Uhrbacteria bacterium]|nr:hypothetical protein [Candidatus Uhrbacteria bacterium]